MDIDQVTTLCTLVQALHPAQFVNVKPETIAVMPTAWLLVLDDVDPHDARTALSNIAKRETFIDPNMIRAEALRIRSRRVEGSDDYVPTVDPDDTARYLAELRWHRKTAGSSPLEGERSAVTARPHARSREDARRQLGGRYAPDPVAPASRGVVRALRAATGGGRALPDLGEVFGGVPEATGAAPDAVERRLSDRERAEVERERERQLEALDGIA